MRPVAATPKPLRAPSAFLPNGSLLEKANPTAVAASHRTSALHFRTAFARRANSLRDWNASHKHWKTARAEINQAANGRPNTSTYIRSIATKVLPLQSPWPFRIRLTVGWEICRRRLRATSLIPV